MDELVRGPGVREGEGMPVGTANATVVKVDMRQGSYGGVCAAVGADAEIVVGIGVASSVSTGGGSMASVEVAFFGPKKWLFSDSSDSFFASLTV